MIVFVVIGATWSMRPSWSSDAALALSGQPGRLTEEEAVATSCDPPEMPPFTGWDPEMPSFPGGAPEMQSFPGGAQFIAPALFLNRSFTTAKYRSYSASGSSVMFA